MLLFSKKCDADEKKICALCEYSIEDEDGFKCGRKRVSPTHSCRKFIYNPQKKKTAKLIFNKNEFTFEAIE